MSNNETQGEIDLIILINKIKSTFLKQVLCLFKGVKFLTKQWKAFVLLIIVGIIIGFFNGAQTDSQKEATVLLKVNFDAVNYVYDAVSLINQKIEANDLDFFNEIGMTTDELDLFELTISPVVNLQEIVENESFKANEIKTLFENLNFDNNLSMTNSFISNYKYHSLTFSFSSLADGQSVDKVINFLNNNPLFKELKLRKNNSITDRVKANENTIEQINNIILKYTGELSANLTSSQLYIDNKDIRPNELIATKMELLKEIELLKEEKIYSNNTVIVINNSNLVVENKSLKDNKLVYYPFILCFIFIVIQIAKNTYNYLDRLERK
ncbi:hypothetical protein OAA78_00235 [Flavobacteriaceae bacterium]|nr:hypothetical protein [Flavobacteriaceae bacterium]MDB9712097.1 hypothetical protein [Flavobacteriaceae bacterium]MDC1492204.1 hypothetical protein [Flavobacteriaceae bacterium]